ncbi:BnaA04g20620D [Brassica napus]|uniref:(rape) hypothetical protein n=2 Tax=Brassica napus TaxID=3708 RepID=A0A078HPH7_BRANA|nr:unnamed protein product [Brassica napus]CDY40455.1 BnaA04g20620D [Brassica napus]
MSKMTTFVPLTKLRPFKDNWRIQVKCLHSWKQNTPFAGDTFEMVLADQWGNKIHATSKRSLMLRIQRVLPIDSWGVIEHVTVTPAGGQYRTTNYKYKMVIAEDAVLSRSDLADDRNFLSLANYEEIENGTKKQAFLIDVIGRIHELGDVQTVQVSAEDRKRVQFRLLDAEGNNLACCLWGTYAEQLEPFAGKDQTIICLIRFAKIKEFRGELQITNAFDASRLFLNPMIPELTQLTERLSNDDLSVALVQKPSGKKDGKKHLYNWNDAEIKTISEAAESTQVEICKIICTIEAIDTDWSWFYIGCNRHQKRVNKIPNVDYGRMTKKDKPLFRCEHCRSNINTVGPKFKLHLVVKDDSATCNLMLLGSVGKSIVAVDAEELWDGSYEEIEDPEILPEPILSLVGKSFCFGISITSDNVTNGSDTFVVLEVCSGDKVLTIETDSQSNSDMVTTSSTMSSGSAMMLDQISSDECPTPITKRKEDNYDLQDLTSSSKKQCIKIIKQEKNKND